MKIIFAECVGTFEDTLDKAFSGTGYDSTDEKTLADCQKTCIIDNPECVAVDYKNITCILISEDEYYAEEFIEKVGNVHSVLKSCDTR